MSLDIAQTALAATVGLSFQQIQKYESGANRLTAGRLVQLAGALGMDPVELLAGVEPFPSIHRSNGDHGRKAQATRMLAAYASISDMGLRSVLLKLAVAASEIPERDQS